ncbi:hypothetical protein GCM10010464_87510 [Pseudonocardia yunnanensis]|uniref:DUF5666 domain-containing protein n=1 Tax=Pseudonocardia yunnanensis TaxID=58107 RepID=A0ABW4F089_9PSEU
MVSSPADDRTPMPPAGWPHDETVALRPKPTDDPAPVDDDLFAENWDKPRRTNRLTAVLVALIMAALAFAGGVAAQKAHDKGLVTASAATRARGAGVGAPGGPAAGGAGGTASPVAIGTVKSISGSTLTLTNSAGAVVTVTVPPTATVTTDGLGGLVAGVTVSVAGTNAADGTVTATSITSHRTGPDSPPRTTAGTP